MKRTHNFEFMNYPTINSSTKVDSMVKLTCNTYHHEINSHRKSLVQFYHAYQTDNLAMYSWQQSIEDYSQNQQNITNTLFLQKQTCGSILSVEILDMDEKYLHFIQIITTNFSLCSIVWNTVHVNTIFSVAGNVE